MERKFHFFIMALILSGCTSEDENITSESVTNEDNYIFTGSNANWEVSYEVDVIKKGPGENQVEEKGTVKFIGENEAPEMINYKLATETGLNSSEGTGTPIYDGIGGFAQGACGNCIPVQVDGELELEIIWNGKLEKVLLIADK